MVFLKNNFKIVRPLLNIHRFEIRQFVRFWKLPIYSDHSNKRTNLLRNKIRKQLLPTLRIFFNPQIDTVLLNFVGIKREEVLYFQSVLVFLLRPQVCDKLFFFFLDIFDMKNDRAKKSAAPKRNVPEVMTTSTYLKRSKGSRLPSKPFHPIFLLHSRSFTQTMSVSVYEVGEKKMFRLCQFITHETSKVMLSYVLLPLRFFCSFGTNYGLRSKAPFESFFRYNKLKATTASLRPPVDAPSLHSPSAVTAAVTAAQQEGTTEQRNKGFGHTPNKNNLRLEMRCNNYLTNFSRNQIICELIIANLMVQKLKKCPNVFQKQVLKTFLKTFNDVENAYLSLSQICYEKKITQLFLLKFTKKLFTQQEKKDLLFILKNVINKYL